MNMLNVINNNCLNVVVWNICTDDFNCDSATLYNILHQHCVTNNVTKIEYIKKLINNYLLHDDTVLSFFNSLLLVCFFNKSFDFANVFLNYRNDYCTLWINHICMRVFCNNFNLDVCDELKFFIKYGQITLHKFSEYICASEMHCKHELLDYVQNLLV